MGRFDTLISIIVHTHSIRAGELKKGPRLEREALVLIRNGTEVNPLGERATEHPRTPGELKWDRGTEVGR